MPRILQTSLAASDLTEIAWHIAEIDPTAADRWLDRIDETCQSLAAMPGMGRPRPELAPQLRSLPVGNYVVFYLPMADGIEIVRVLHGARDLPPLFE